VEKFSGVLEEQAVSIFSPNSIRVIKSRRLRWAGHVACMVERRGAYKAFVGKLEGRRPFWKTQV
jgi:hypothetical protein